MEIIESISMVALDFKATLFLLEACYRLSKFRIVVQDKTLDLGLAVVRITY